MRSQPDCSSITSRGAPSAGVMQAAETVPTTRRSTRLIAAKVSRSICSPLLARHDEHSRCPRIVLAVEEPHAAPGVPECLVDRLFPEELVIEQARVLLRGLVLDLPAKSKHCRHAVLSASEGEPCAGGLAPRQIEQAGRLAQRRRKGVHLHCLWVIRRPDEQARV